MGALLFGNKLLWSGLWSGYGRYGQVGGGHLGKRSDHSDHGLTIGVTIALLLPNKRVTIVTIALFWVLTRGTSGHGQNGPFGQNGPKLDTTCLATTAPGVEENCKATKGDQQNQKMDTSGAKVN